MLSLNNIGSQIFWLISTFLAFFLYVRYVLFPLINNRFTSRNNLIAELDVEISEIRSKIAEIEKENNQLIDQSHQAAKKAIRKIVIQEEEKISKLKLQLNQSLDDLIQNEKELSADVSSKNSVKMDYMVQYRKSIESISDLRGAK